MVEQVGIKIKEMISALQAHQPKQLDWSKLQEKKDISKTERYETLTVPSESCPFCECDGSGLIIVLDHDFGGEIAKICRCRAFRVIEKKLNFAAIPEEFKNLTIASFEVNVYRQKESRVKAALAKRIAANFVKNFGQMQEKGKGLYLYSCKPGSGKTRLAASIGNALIKTHQVSAKFITTIGLIKEIQSTYDEETGLKESELIDAIKQVDVLILDDIGTEKHTNWVNETFFNILDSRMSNRKITIFTSNAKIEELQHGEKIKNRIRRMAVPVNLPEESIRDNLAMKENEELQVLLLGSL